VPGQDHTSLNDAALGVGHNAVQVPVPALHAVEASVLLAGSVQVARIVPGGWVRRGGHMVKLLCSELKGVGWWWGPLLVAE